MSQKRILLMEDDEVLALTIEELLREDGYRVDLVRDGEEAAERSYENDYDLYIFDINVPEIDGFELLEGLRGAQDRTPTVFISAMVDLNTIAKGFALGADDYIKKPFFPEELLIRVNAKIGRGAQTIRCGCVEYDPARKEVRKDGELIGLGEVQFALLDLFMRNRKQVIDKDTLLACLEHPTAAALRVAIAKLKQTTGLPVKNIRGVGYTLEAC